MKKKSSLSARGCHDEPKRPHRMICLMSEEEYRSVNRYLKRYKITNKQDGRYVNVAKFWTFLKALLKEIPVKA